MTGTAVPTGWRLGATRRPSAAETGADEPVRSPLTAAHVLDHGQSLQVADHPDACCQPVIAFVMGDDLAGPHVTSTEVLAATAGVAAAVEVLDSRGSGDSPTARYLLGPSVPVTGIDLRLVGVVVEHDGDVVATASGAASLGHPAAAVGWLVRSLAADGEGLRRGQVVLSGGLTPPTPVSAGGCVVVTVDRLGSVELACR